jgi:Na+-driven multidrug efflux pump
VYHYYPCRIKAGPLFFVILVKIACYAAMTTNVTQFGIVPLAAHNVMMSMFFFFSTFGDAMSQTVETFLPPTLYPQYRPTQYRQILRRLLMIATVLGVVNGRAAVHIVRNVGSLLTDNVMVIELMQRNALYFGLAVLLHPFILLLEGTVVASGEFRSLMTTYISTSMVHFVSLRFMCGSFSAIWRTFVLFQCMRFINFAYRVIHKYPYVISQTPNV